MIFSIRSILLLLVTQLVSGLPLPTPEEDSIIHNKDYHDKILENYKVGSLPGLDKIQGEVPIMYAGHLEINSTTDTNYFFWKFSKPNQAQNRTIFWLNGGPGCSSMDGALMEVGPLRVNSKIEVEFNNGSWYELGDMVFVDQPGGTGFSYTDVYDKELSEVADDFMIFLQKFYELFPNDLSNEIYIAGESYAGQYIPYIARSIQNSTSGSNYDLQGLLIGNGWISPNEQSLSYIPFLLQNDLISQKDPFFPDLLKRQENCQNAINHGEHSLTRTCDSILDYILGYTRDEKLQSDEQCINMYDFRLKDSFPSCGMNWPPLLPYVNKFLQDEKVMKLLNLKKTRKWNECDNEVSRNLKLQHSQQAIVFLPELLQDLKVMLFNGDKDIICNTFGMESVIKNLNWAGSMGFTQGVEPLNWYFDETAAGVVKSEDNLTFVTVYNASHMVPFDNSAVSRSLMDIMLDNVSPYKDGFTTPLYTRLITSPQNSTSSSPSHQSKPDYDKVISSHSIIFYIFEIIVVIIILYGIHYFYKYYNDISSRKPTSILHNHGNGNNNNNNGNMGIITKKLGNKINNSNKRSKQVHWIDEMTEDGSQTPLEQEIDDFNGKNIGYTNTNNTITSSNSSSNKRGIVGSLLGNWSSSYTKVPTENVDKDIEMTGGEVVDYSRMTNEDFIIESDED